MSKIGRNDPCPCGSGKKYKNCHLSQDKEQSSNEDGEPETKSVPTFKHLVENYHSDPIINLIGALQLLPKNHGQEARFEEMARVALLYRRENDTRPYASWQRLVAVIGNIGYPDDDPTNAFTENVVFSEGNYVVYPGIYVGVTNILNQLLECIYLQENTLPEKFKKQVNDGVGLLLFMSNKIAEEKGHGRYMERARMSDYKIAFSDYDSTIDDAFKIKFEKDYLKKVCGLLNCKYDIIKEFILPLNYPDLNKDDPDENPVSRKPLIDQGENIILYMPSTVVNALMEFIFQKSDEHKCLELITEMLHEKQFDNSFKALAHLDWLATDIQLPENSENLPIQEMVFQFDNQKFGYVCFINTLTSEVSNPIKDNVLEKRNQKVVKHLETFSKEQTFQVLSLFVLAETGRDGFFAWQKPSAGNQSLAFQYSELMTLAYSENVNALTLWKFAKTYGRTGEKIRIMSMGGTLDAYAIYRKNHGSLLHSDEANPFDGMMMIVNGSSNDFRQEVQRNNDEHAVLLFDGKMVGYTKVVREKKYAPIYTDKFVNREFRRVIENFRMPVWVTNYQAKKKGDSSWAHHICEATAFWLMKMESHLKPALENISLVQLEIEIIVDENLLQAENFEIKDMPIDAIEITIEIDAPKIKLKIPFEFLYAVRLADNTADKLLMRAALQGIVSYIEEAGKKIDFDINRIGEIIEETLQPSQAKMILFSDASRNVRMDNRKLPPMRYIQEADISYILDNLVSYLPEGYPIPDEIHSIDERKKLCDDVVSALIEQIKSKISVFDGEMLIQWLIKANEKAVQVKEFREILIPAKIACFSDFESEVKEMQEKEEDLVTTSHALRTFIEFVAINIPAGIKWANFDDIDELLALTNQLTTWGATSEAMRFDLANPRMGLLPSGRIGTEKTMQREILEPYSEAKSISDVFQYIEKFEKNYLPVLKQEEAIPTGESIELDEAFKEEFGLTLTRLSQIIGVMINMGFSKGESCVKIEKDELTQIILSDIKDISAEEIEIALSLLTLVKRPAIEIPPSGYKQMDIFPWRYTRSLSYLRRPLVRYDQQDGKAYYYFGFRHLMAYIDNLYFLLFTGKLPESSSEKMRSWIASILAEKGKPYRNAVRDWFKEKTSFQVIEHEVTMKPGGHLESEKDYGDIDVLVIDHERKIVYSIECKNSVGARNIHEMKSEMDLYLGRDGNDKKAKIKKHVERDKWLKENQSQLKKFLVDSETYTIKSFILTADEIPLPYLKKEVLPMPIKSFVFLRKDGTTILDDLK
jgi:hypothetical protein